MPQTALQSPNNPQANGLSYTPLPANGLTAPPVTFGVPALPSTATKTVVTAKPATTDLAVKQANVQTAATAMAQPKPALGIPAQPQQQPQQGGQPITPTQPQQPPPKPVAPPNSTTGQLLSMLQSGNVSLTSDQVRQVVGLGGDASGFQQNPDGTFTADASAKARVEQQNGPQAPSTGDPTQDYIQQQRTALDAQAQTNYDNYTKQLQQLADGSFPLTQSQQAQLNALQGQFDALKQQQLVANENYTGAITTLGIRAGRNRYAPEIESGNIQNSINIGLSKIADINAKAATAVASLQQGFADNDYKLINAQYTALQDLMKHKDDSLKEMQQSIKDQMDMQTQKLTQQKSLMDIETSTINNTAQAVLNDALLPDGSLDFDLIQQAANDYGVDPNQLYSAVLKQKDDYTKMQQEEQKFSTDQVTAKLNQQKIQTDINMAPLDAEAKRASIASSYANAAKTKLETQKLQQEVGGPTNGAVTPFIKQPGYAALTTKQKTQADSLNNLVRSLTKYRSDLDTNVKDKSGLAFFGENAAALESQLNSIIFAAAQAEGTGALQQADRQVIEKIVPNPTSFTGALSTATKGGKAGELKKLDEIIGKYTANLKSYGLNPIGDNVVTNPGGGEDIEITD